jgi:hypothetical protein
VLAQVQAHAVGPFAPHGVMSVHQQGPLITCVAHGPFNTEFMVAYGRMWMQHLQVWTGEQAFVLFTVWQGSMLASPDALAHFGGLVKIASTGFPPGTLNLWQVPADIEGRSLMLPLWRQQMLDNGLLIEIVEDEAAAHAHIDAFVAQRRGALGPADPSQ